MGAAQKIWDMLSSPDIESQKLAAAILKDNEELSVGDWEELGRLVNSSIQKDHQFDIFCPRDEAYGHILSKCK